jgi:hypothetical protein
VLKAVVIGWRRCNRVKRIEGACCAARLNAAKTKKPGEPPGIRVLAVV